MVRTDVRRPSVRRDEAPAAGYENKKAGPDASLQHGDESCPQEPDHQEERVETQGDRFRDAASWRYGYPFTHSRRQQRVAQEVVLLQEARFRVSWDQAEGSWVRIEDFPLPGREPDRARLLIQIPVDFPDTPPNGAYIDRPMPHPGHYYWAPHLKDPSGQQPWTWFCFHVGQGGGGWRASTHVAAGDNLLKYVKLIFALFRDRGGYP